MSKKVKIISVGVACVVAAYFGTTYYLGNKLNSEMPAIVEQVNQSLQKTNLPLSLNINQVEKGFFSTKAVVNVLSNKDVLISFDVVAKHGPFPGFSSLGLASFAGTLKNDENLQGASPISNMPIALALNGQVSLVGNTSVTIDMEPLNDSFLGADITTDKIVLGLEAKANNDVSWSLSTNKFAISERGSDEENQVTIEGFKLSGHSQNLAGDKTASQIQYQLQIASTVAKNTIEPILSGQVKNVDVIFALNSHEDFTDASYAFSLSDLKIGALALNAVNTKLNFKQIPTAELQGNLQLAPFTLPFSLRQSILMNDEAILTAKPSVELESFKVTNTSGQFIGNGKLVLGQMTPSAEASSDSVDFAGLPLKEANIDLKAERVFLNQLASELIQINTGIDKDSANTQAPLVLEEILNISTFAGDLLQANDKDIAFNFILKDDKATLNQTVLSKESMQEIVQFVFAML